MRKLLAVMLMGGALIVSTSAAFAQEPAWAPTRPVVGQSSQSGSYTVDEQSTPCVSNTQAVRPSEAGRPDPEVRAVCLLVPGPRLAEPARGLQDAGPQAREGTASQPDEIHTPDRSAPRSNHADAARPNDRPAEEGAVTWRFCFRTSWVCRSLRRSSRGLCSLCGSRSRRRQSTLLTSKWSNAI